MTRDVLFDEMSSSYKPVNVIDDVDAQNAQQQSQNISGPGVSSSSGSHSSPWTGRLRLGESPQSNADSGMQVSRKGKEKVDQPMFGVNVGHSYVDGESSGSERSIDDELDIPYVVTLGVRKTRDVLRAPRSEPILHRSTRARYPVDRLKYDGFTAIHYAYMVKVIQK